MIPTTTGARGNLPAERTDWYPPFVEPAREGVYELGNTSTGIHFFARWTRQGWCVGSLNLGMAASSIRISVVQNRWPWRGLKEQAC